MIVMKKDGSANCAPKTNRQLNEVLRDINAADCALR